MVRKRDNKGDNSRDEDDLDEEDHDEDEEQDEDSEEDDDEESELPFTQEQFDRAVARARKNARRAQTDRMLAELGVKDLNEARKLITTAQKKPKTPPKEEESESTEKDDEIQKLKRQLAERDRTDRVKEALEAAGVIPAKRHKAARLLDFDSEDPSEDEIADEISELREEWPELFQSGSEDEEDSDDDDDEPKTRKRSSSAPPAPKRKRKGKSPGDRAMERLKQRHPNAFAEKS